MINVCGSYNETRNACQGYKSKNSFPWYFFNKGKFGKFKTMPAGLGTFLKLTKCWRMNNNLLVLINTNSIYLGVHSDYRSMFKTQAIRFAYRCRSERKGVKSERDLTTGMEDENEIIKARE